jgi:hypothetical protein
MVVGAGLAWWPAGPRLAGDAAADVPGQGLAEFQVFFFSPLLCHEFHDLEGEVEN